MLRPGDRPSLDGPLQWSFWRRPGHQPSREIEHSTWMSYHIASEYLTFRLTIWHTHSLSLYIYIYRCVCVCVLYTCIRLYTYVVYGVNAPRRAWFFPRLWSLAVYVFNALADCNSLRWRYRRHVAQLCCWRLATLTGRGGGGGDDNVPFDRKMTLPKTRCPTLLLTSCYLDREGGFWGGGDDNVPFDRKMTPQ